MTLESFAPWALACANAGLADITLQTDQPPRGNLDGIMRCLGARPWDADETMTLICGMYGSDSAAASLAAGDVLDFGWHPSAGRGVVQSFRVNVTSIRPVRGGDGIEATLRVLPRSTPTAAGLGLDDALVQAMRPETGVVIVAGATGAGKSTTLAALARTHLEGDRPRKVIDLQAPIEFTFSDLLSGGRGGRAASFGQSEIGRHVPDWAAGVRSALRRAPDVICLGEARDLETIRAVLEAAMTGHLIYTTTHAGSLAEVVRRLLTVFDAGSRDAMAFDLACALRFVMVQRLEIAPDGGRVALRAALEVTDRLRGKMLAATPDEWPAMLDRWTAPGGEADGIVRSFADHAAELVAAGRLAPEIGARHASG